MCRVLRKVNGQAARGEGRQALARVVAGEGALPELRLAREGLVERQIREFEHRFLDGLQRLAAERGQTLGALARHVAQLPRWRRPG